MPRVGNPASRSQNVRFLLSGSIFAMDRWEHVAGLCLAFAVVWPHAPVCVLCVCVFFMSTG